MTARFGAESIEGIVTTRPLSFTGRHLFVNADCRRGELRAEVLDASGHVVVGFSRADSLPFRGDSTCAPMAWTNGTDLSRLSGAPVRLRFCLTGGHLYAFWVAGSLSGASGGYSAMGGPGLGETDVEGAGRR